MDVQMRECSDDGRSDSPPMVAQSRRVAKLGRLMGRKDSIEQIGEFLMPTTADEAIKNRDRIEKSDKMKKMFGSRPPLLSTSHQPSSSSSSSSQVSPSSPSSMTLTAAATSSRVAKVRSMTGRRMSVDAIQDLLLAETPEEALHNARLIERSDKLRDIMGQRPPTNVLLMPQPQSPTAKQMNPRMARRLSSNKIMTVVAVAGDH